MRQTREERQEELAQISRGLSLFKGLFSKNRTLKSELVNSLRTMNEDDHKALLAYLFKRSDKRTAKAQEFIGMVRAARKLVTDERDKSRQCDGQAIIERNRQQQLENAKGTSSMRYNPYDLSDTANHSDR